MKNNLMEKFKKPGNECRGVPFWSWNGELEPGELRRQIRVMRRMGFGGFFMHSRTGLSTEYLSDKWFECVGACVDEAKKFGMDAWLYDEDRWPSGAAGGLVTKNRKFSGRHLVMEESQALSGLREPRRGEVLFKASADGETLLKYKKISGGLPRKLAPGERILRFSVKIHDPSDWHNGQTYLDTMNPAAVKEFIRVTHESYRKRFGKEMGKTIPGIFTDEPLYGYSAIAKDSDTVWRTVWTDAFPGEFRKRFGYSIEERLPEIFFMPAEGKVSKVKLDYFECLTSLFTGSFAKQIGEWCEKNNMRLTGHCLREDTLQAQTQVTGDCMRFYEHMQIPGMDLLTERWLAYDTAKQVSSVARQFRKKWRLTETYGGAGWDFTFEGHKALGDWQAALGINLRCQHLAYYTMEGEAKRDYPASVFYQSPWWESYSKVEDYFARINQILSRGKERRCLLVIHPVESMWSLAGKEWHARKDVTDLNELLIKTRNSLLAAGIDFDYGSEGLLAEHGAVSGKKGKAVLRLKHGEYKAALVPPLRTIRKSTLKLLEKFHAAGGKVVFAGPAPDYVGGEPSDAAKKLAVSAVSVPFKAKDIVSSIEKECRIITIKNSNGADIHSVLFNLREDRDCYYLFLCNTGVDDSEGVKLYDGPFVAEKTLKYERAVVSGLGECEGAPLELDPSTGEIFLADAGRKGGIWNIKTSFPRLGSRLFVIPKKTGVTAPKHAALKVIKTVKISAGPKIDVIRSEDNVLVLDKPEFSFDRKKWEAAPDVIKADDAMRERMSLKRRGGAMKQPWVCKKEKTDTFLGEKQPLSLRYVFQSEINPPGPLCLALERPELYKISVNGEAVSTDAQCGWWCDKSLKKVPLPSGALKKGENELLLETVFQSGHPGLEIIYLLGPFGVELKGAKPVLTGPESKLELGDWTKQGLPFYSGNVAYCFRAENPAETGERVFLRVGDYKGVALKVRVNGKDAGVMAWEPYELEIGSLLERGANDIAVEILGHRKNSHGPHHWNVGREDRDFFCVAANSFRTEGKKFRADYDIVPCGLMSAPELVIKKQWRVGGR